MMTPIMIFFLSSSSGVDFVCTFLVWCTGGAVGRLTRFIFGGVLAIGVVDGVAEDAGGAGAGAAGALGGLAGGVIALSSAIVF